MTRKCLVIIALFHVILFTNACSSQSTETVMVSTPSSPPTSTIIPTNTKGIELTITPIPSKTPTQRPTSIPTLDKEAADQEILKLMATNGNCSLPCFWGIVPGKTMVRENSQLFRKLRISLGWGMNIGDLQTIEGGIDLDNGMRFSINLFEDNDLITAIWADFDLLDQPGYSKENWEPYTLRQLLLQHGIPSEVKFSAGFNKELGMSYPSMRLVFTEEKITITIYSEIKESGNTIKICPNRDDEKVSGFQVLINMKPEIYYWYDDYKWFSLSELVDLDEVGFYDLFLNGNEDSCLFLDRQPLFEDWLDHGGEGDQ